MHKEDGNAKDDGTECSDKPECWIWDAGRWDKPSDQRDFRDDHDSEPEPEVYELFFDAIKFGHGSYINVGASLALTSAF